jgi:hypothetical protein
MHLASAVVTVPRPGQKFASVYFENEPARCAHLPWRSTIMRAASIPLLVSFLVTLLLIQAAQSVSTQPVPWHPCAKIAQACTRAGFVPDGAKSLQIMSDCIRPIMLGTPKQQAVGLPQIDPQIVAACKERDPNFGMSGRVRTESGT